jgi:hypothetical protein
MAHVAEHWHGYTYVGQERPPDSMRRDPSNPTPPLEIADWLRKPKSLVKETFPNDPAGAKLASEWMRACGTEHVYLGEAAFPLDDRMAYVDEALSRGADVVWGYYTQRTSYVSQALVACPRPSITCPYGQTV